MEKEIDKKKDRAVAPHRMTLPCTVIAIAILIEIKILQQQQQKSK